MSLLEFALVIFKVRFTGRQAKKILFAIREYNKHYCEEERISEYKAVAYLRKYKKDLKHWSLKKNLDKDTYKKN